MTEERIKKLLKETDRIAGAPAEVRVSPLAIRQRANRRRILNYAGPVAAAAVLLIAIAIWRTIPNLTKETPPELQQIASGEAQLQQLQASTEKAINLIQEILEQQQRQRRLDELDAQLAAIPDPLEKIQEEIDRTAFILVYSADRMYNELNLTDSAVQTYKRVIELFPENQWAKVANERLEKIQSDKINNRSQGESKWKLQNALS